MPHPDGLLTIAEAAALVGLTDASVREAVARGSIPTVLVDVPRKRIRRADILAHSKRTRGASGRPRGS